jgi:hypothetical protein
MKITWLIILLPSFQNYQWADTTPPLVKVKIKKLANVNGGQLQQGNLGDGDKIKNNKSSQISLEDGGKLQQDNPSANDSIKTIFDDVPVKKSMAVELIKVSKKTIVHKKKSRWNRFTSFVKESFQTLRSYLKPIALGLLVAVIISFNNGSLSGTAIKNLLFFFPEASS